MLFVDIWRLWQALYREGGLVITTVDAHGMGIRTLLQPDGDVIIRVSAALADPEAMERRHAADVAQALRALYRLRQALHRYAAVHASIGWHVGGSMLEYARQGFWSSSGAPFTERAWFSEGGLLFLVIGAVWVLQRLLPSWLGAAHDWWTAVLTSGGPWLTCGALWGYERWACGAATCPWVEAMHPVIKPLLVAGGFGVLRLLFKYTVRWYIRRTLGLA